MKKINTLCVVGLAGIMLAGGALASYPSMSRHDLSITKKPTLCPTVHEIKNMKFSEYHYDSFVGRTFFKSSNQNAVVYVHYTERQNKKMDYIHRNEALRKLHPARVVSNVTWPGPGKFNTLTCEYLGKYKANNWSYSKFPAVLYRWQPSV